MIDQRAPLPTGLRHERFVAVPLTSATAALDYSAYVASPDVIRTHSDGRWPVEGFTLADDLELVAVHEDEHRRRRAFTFVLLTPSETEALGCLYLNPLRDYLVRTGAPRQVIDGTPRDSAMVTFWLRQDHRTTGLADDVVEAVDAWLRDEWPLERALFRVLPAERGSRSALERLGLGRVELELPGEPRPYLWFEARL